MDDMLAPKSATLTRQELVLLNTLVGARIMQMEFGSGLLTKGDDALAQANRRYHADLKALRIKTDLMCDEAQD